MDILFFSRGRGRGHATRDVAIAEALRHLAPRIDIAFASYDSGADSFRSSGESVFDLNLPESNLFTETVVRAGLLMRRTTPKIVVAQEEPAALVAGKVFELRTIFTTHWFPTPNRIGAHALNHADTIVFMEDQGIFDEPPQVRGRVVYCGPVLKRFKHDPTDRLLIRKELGLAPASVLLLVLPGSPPESREPIFELVTKAFGKLGNTSKRLLWIAGDDYLELSERASSMSEIDVIRWTRDIDRLMIASNLIITKGTYNIGREAMALGKPSISITHEFNRIDDIYSRRWPTNLSFRAAMTSPSELAIAISDAISRSEFIKPDKSLLQSNGAQLVARILLERLQA